jgi:hypothetical protein
MHFLILLGILLVAGAICFLSIAFIPEIEAFLQWLKGGK